MMSNTCCEVETIHREECEPDGDCYCETEIVIKNEGKDLKRWLKFLRWIGVKIEEKPKELHKIEVSEKFEDDDIHPESHPLWDTNPHWGWVAIFNAIGGRGRFNIGPKVTYDKWVIGIDNQAADRDRMANDPITVTPILPFDEAYTGHPAVKLL